MNTVHSIVTFRLPWRDRLRALVGQEIRVRVQTELTEDGRAATSSSQVEVGRPEVRHQRAAYSTSRTGAHG